MKKVIACWIFVIGSTLAHAQRFSEWFQQKETQIKYLVEQIGALKAYGEVMCKGYDIAHNGLTNIFENKSGDMAQHSAFFQSLRKVNPGIKKWAKVAAIGNMKMSIDKSYSSIKSYPTAVLDAKEKNYINTVYSSLIDECNFLVQELNTIIDDGIVELKDDERIERIDKIFVEMQDRYEFSKYFNDNIKLLVLNRVRERYEIQKLGELYHSK